MKKMTIGTFAERSDAEGFISAAHTGLGISHDDISYLYKDVLGREKEVDTRQVSADTPAEGAEKGAKAGAAIGTLGGIAAVLGVIPIIGPLFAAGPLVAAVGITGALGTTAAGALTGAAAGGILGALLNMGVSREKAKKYEDRVIAGNILVSVNSENDREVEESMMKHNAMEVDTYTPTLI